MIRPFIENVPSDPNVLASLRARALVHPVYRRTLVSDDARTAALNLRFHDMDDATFIERGVDGRILDVLTRGLEGTLGHHVAGRPHVKVNVYRGIVSDLLRLAPLVALVLVGVLVVFLGGWSGALVPLLASLIALVWTHAILVYSGHALNLLTALLAPMLLALGSVYGVHVVNRHDESARSGATPAMAAQDALREIRLPALIAGVTTAIGFAALFVSDVPAVRAFGGFSIVGVLAATLTALSFIPAALASWGREGSHADTRTARALDAGLDGLAGWVGRRRIGILLGSTAIAVLALALLPRIVIDTDHLSNFDPAHPVRVDFEAVNARLAGAVPLYVTIDGGAGGAMREPELLEAMAGLQRAIDEIEGVGRSISILDSLRPLNRAFSGDDPAMERIPTSRRPVSSSRKMSSSMRVPTTRSMSSRSRASSEPSTCEPNSPTSSGIPDRRSPGRGPARCSRGKTTGAPVG